MKAVFKPQIELFDEIFGLRSLIRQCPWMILNEVNLTRCDPNFALEKGGSMTKWILHQMLPLVELQETPDHSPYIVVDCKYVFLEPGHFATFPGWHCDTTDKTLDDSFPYPIEMPANPQLALEDRWNWQITVSENGEPISEPLVATSDAEIEYDPERPWTTIGAYLDNEYQGEFFQMSPLVPMKYNGHALHKVSPAIRKGWRYWLRIQQFPTPPQNIMHQISRVYCDIANLPNHGEKAK